MGQTMTHHQTMAKPPHHRSGEHFIVYDANAWRRLSSTYLNQLIDSGKCSKDELDIIELERYWQSRERSNQIRSHSSSPFERQRYKHLNRSNQAVSSSNLNLSSSNRKPDVVKNLQQSSHKTKQGDYRYHSLVNVSSIKPTHEQIKKIANDLNSNSSHYRTDSAFSNYSSNQQESSFLLKNNRDDHDNHDDHDDYDDRQITSPSSTDSGFNRLDSLRSTGEQRNFRSNTNIDPSSTERLVQQKQNNSSFQRRQQQSKTPDFRINSQEDLDNSYRPIRKTKFIPKRNGSFRLMHQNQNKHLQSSLINNNNNNINDNQFQSNYAQYYQRFDRPRLFYTKIIYIILLIANIAMIIWQSVYMHFAMIKIKLGEPIDGRLCSMTHTERNIWKSIVIIIIIIMNSITTMIAIYAAIRHRYWPIFIATILFYLYAVFGAYSQFLRGSISSWLSPMFCAHFSIIITHQLAINHYSSRDERRLQSDFAFFS